MIEKLAQLEKTHQELTQRLMEPAIFSDPKVYREVNKTLSEIDPAVKLYREYVKAEQQKRENEEMLAGLSKDDELYALAQDEKEQLTARVAELEEQLRRELTPKDPNDERNVVLEIRAGTGGDEATLFAAELFRMYSRYAETHRLAAAGRRGRGLRPASPGRRVSAAGRGRR
ncbi:MAG TPA: PCRF domain-containing protein [Thermoanaerobaculia bacterium]|nr:PCRF domain-containing protein [Thermoanaerobaculia bacterium]